MNVGEGPINEHHTHRRADDTLSRFAFVTMFSWQSWNPSLSLTRRQGSSQWGSSARKSRNHGELLRCTIIKNSHSAGTHFPKYVFFFGSFKGKKHYTVCSKANGMHMFIIYLFELMHLY